MGKYWRKIIKSIRNLSKILLWSFQMIFLSVFKKSFAIEKFPSFILRFKSISIAWRNPFFSFMPCSIECTVQREIESNFLTLDINKNLFTNLLALQQWNIFDRVLYFSRLYSEIKYFFFSFISKYKGN